MQRSLASLAVQALPNSPLNIGDYKENIYPGLVTAYGEYFASERDALACKQRILKNKQAFTDVASKIQIFCYHAQSMKDDFNTLKNLSTLDQTIQEVKTAATLALKDAREVFEKHRDDIATIYGIYRERYIQIRQIIDIWWTYVLEDIKAYVFEESPLSTDRKIENLQKGVQQAIQNIHTWQSLDIHMPNQRVIGPAFQHGNSILGDELWNKIMSPPRSIEVYLGWLNETTKKKLMGEALIHAYFSRMSAASSRQDGGKGKEKKRTKAAAVQKRGRGRGQRPGK